MTIIDHTGFKVPQSVFEERDLSTYTKYVVKCTGKKTGYADTTVLKTFAMNLKPYGGTCELQVNEKPFTGTTGNIKNRRALKYIVLVSSPHLVLFYILQLSDVISIEMATNIVNNLNGCKTKSNC